MITEIAQIQVNAGTEHDFAAAVEKAVPLFKQAKGCLSMRLERCVERGDRFFLIIDWETLDNHVVDFRESLAFQEWRGLVGGFFAGPPEVEHYSRVVAGF